MKQPETLQLLLLDLMSKWEDFVQQTRQHGGFKQLSEHDKGFVMGFEAAAKEVRTLIAQVSGLDVENSGAADIVLTAEESPVPEWEYLYVTFEQTQAGVWRIKSMTGGENFEWQDAASFDEAVQQLRSNEGWRLTTFAKGIHVFRRPINPLL